MEPCSPNINTFNIIELSESPVGFSTIGVCDGLAMGLEGMEYFLSSRELVADSVEIMAMACPFDGLVMICNCDKIIAGMLMAMLRLNIPAILVSGGPMLAGTLGDRTVDLISVFEAVGARHTGRINEETFTQLENCACPGVVSCAGMFTANSMNCLSEALGLALPGSGTLPAVSAARMSLAKEAGMKVMALMEKDIRPRNHPIPEKVSAKQKIRKLNGLPTSRPSIFKEWFMACLGT